MNPKKIIEANMSSLDNKLKQCFLLVMTIQ